MCFTNLNYIIVHKHVLVNIKMKGAEPMSECRYTQFGILVKTKLLSTGRTQKWLEQKIQKETGLFVDSSYMHKILTGQRNPQKIISCISKILNISMEQ